MRYLELLRLALGGIRRTPLRVALTALGVTIATGSLVCMVAFALGIQARVEEPFQKSELLNRIDVSPKGTFRGFGPRKNEAGSSKDKSEASVVLDNDALSDIQALSGVALAYPELRLQELKSGTVTSWKKSRRPDCPLRLAACRSSGMPWLPVDFLTTNLRRK